MYIVACGEKPNVRKLAKIMVMTCICQPCTPGTYFCWDMKYYTALNISHSEVASYYYRPPE